MTGEKTVLAIDPGSSKCGLAVVRRDAEEKLSVLHRSISQADQTATDVGRLHEEYKFTLLIVGSGTKSKTLVAAIREVLPSLGVLIVDEKDTTMQARERYWEANPRRGWRKLLPATLQVPPEPIDDYAAVVLAERVLAPA